MTGGYANAPGVEPDVPVKPPLPPESPFPLPLRPSPSPAAAGLPAEDVERVARALCPMCEQPLTIHWWVCSDPLAEMQPTAAEEAVKRLIAVAPVMWHGDYPVKAVPVSDLLSVLALAPVPHDADGGERR